MENSKQWLWFFRFQFDQIHAQLLQIQVVLDSFNCYAQLNCLGSIQKNNKILFIYGFILPRWSTGQIQLNSQQPQLNSILDSRNYANIFMDSTFRFNYRFALLKYLTRQIQLSIHSSLSWTQFLIHISTCTPS